MVKSIERVRRKMLTNVRAAGAELAAGMEEAEDPIDIALRNPAEHAKKIQDGLNRSIQSGKYEQGLKKAKGRNAWKSAIPMAAQRYEQSADKMVERSLEDYEARKKVIEAAQNAIKNMPKGGVENGIARSATYTRTLHEGYNKLYGRK